MLSQKGDKLNQVGEIHTKFKSQVIIKGNICSQIEFLCVFSPLCTLFLWEPGTWGGTY